MQLITAVLFGVTIHSACCFTCSGVCSLFNIKWTLYGPLMANKLAVTSSILQYGMQNQSFLHKLALSMRADPVLAHMCNTEWSRHKQSRVKPLISVFWLDTHMIKKVQIFASKDDHMNMHVQESFVGLISRVQHLPRTKVRPACTSWERAKQNA